MATKHPATQLSLRKLRAEGWTCAVTEHFVKQPHMAHGVRQDLFGFCDILAIREGRTLAIQCTSYGGVSDRIRKLKALDEVQVALLAGWEVRIHGWHHAAKGARWELKRDVPLELNPDWTPSSTPAVPQA